MPVNLLTVMAGDSGPSRDTDLRTLDIEVQGQKITGEYYGDKFEGSVDGNAIHFVAKDSSGGTSKVDGVLQRQRAYRAR